MLNVRSVRITVCKIYTQILGLYVCIFDKKQNLPVEDVGTKFQTLKNLTHDADINTYVGHEYVSIVSM